MMGYPTLDPALSQLADIRVEVDGRGLLIATFDKQGRDVNSLGRQSMAMTHAIFDRVEASAEIRGVLLMSAKPRNFIAGGEVTEMMRLADRAEGEVFARAGQAIYGRIARQQKPVIAAIHGACMGGGVELALACRARLASDARVTRFALPEILLGFIPGCGGTQRLPRLVGVVPALRMLLLGGLVSARRALALGLVDAVLPERDFRAASIASAHRMLDRSSSLRPARALLARAPRLAGAGFSLLRGAARAHVGREFPAPERLLSAVEHGLVCGLDAGLHREAEIFAELATSPLGKQMMQIFLLNQELRQDEAPDRLRQAARARGAVAGLPPSVLRRLSALEPLGSLLS